MDKKNEIGLIVYAFGELATYLVLFFYGGFSRLAITLEGGGGSYSDFALLYGSMGVLFIAHIIFILLYYHALEKAKGKLFLNFPI